jgi:hypothetical protein
MSLVEALFLDPYPHNANSLALFPRNYFIAQRSDGLFGSGTASDPWDGSGTRFDDRMKDIKQRLADQQTPQPPSLKIGARVTLGPGQYTTKGYSDDDGRRHAL